MQKLTETKFFLLIKKSIYKNEVEIHNIQDVYEEFISIIVKTSMDNSQMNLFYNQLKYIQIELSSLKRMGSKGKENTRYKTYIKKSIHFIEAQLELIKWKSILDGYDFKSHTTKAGKPKNTKLQWTGSIVELVELAYAALECKSFNDGDIEIKELIAQLSEFLNINVKDCYRAFVDIRQRTGDRTIYLDKLKTRMIGKLNKMDNK